MIIMQCRSRNRLESHCELVNCCVGVAPACGDAQLSLSCAAPQRKEKTKENIHIGHGELLRHPQKGRCKPAACILGLTGANLTRQKSIHYHQ